jgi:hypothetical protein
VLARPILGRLRIQYVLSRHGFFMNLNEPLCRYRHGEEAALTKEVDSLRNETFLPLESSWVKRQCGGGNRSSARKPVSCSLAKFGGKMRRKVHPSPYPPVSERSTDSDRMIAEEILLLPPHQCRAAWPAVVSHIKINSGIFPSWYARAGFRAIIKEGQDRAEGIARPRCFGSGSKSSRRSHDTQCLTVKRSAYFGTLRLGIRFARRPRRCLLRNQPLLEVCSIAAERLAGKRWAQDYLVRTVRVGELAGNFPS